MAEVGGAARAGQDLGQSTSAKLHQLARRAPLDPQPYLVAGALAEKAGQGATAERLFAMARARDPRSGAARYFLATRYLKTGRVGEGLEEMAATARLVPGTASMVPAFASFATAVGYTRELGVFLTRHPEFRDSVLDQLAGDPVNVPLVLRLAGTHHRATAPSPDWRVKLVDTLIKAGRYADARKVWAALSGLRNPADLYNPAFQATGAPPPFNWRFDQGTAGLTEPRDGGGLEIVYYGRSDSTFVSQTLTLAPGSYRLSATIAATSAKTGLTWVVTCLPAGNVIARMPLERQGAGPVSTDFSIPGACGAQTLALVATSQDVARTTEVTLTNLSLRKGPA